MDNRLKKILIEAISKASPEDIKATLKYVEKSDTQSIEAIYNIQECGDILEFFQKFKAKPEKEKRLLIAIKGDPFIEIIKSVATVDNDDIPQFLFQSPGLSSDGT